MEEDAATGVRQSPSSLGLAIQHRLLASIIIRFLINQNSEASAGRTVHAAVTAIQMITTYRSISETVLKL